MNPFTILSSALLLAFTTLQISAQMPADSSSANVPPLKHYAGWSLSYAGGTPSDGRPTPLFSTFYGHPVAPFAHVEFGLHYIDFSDAQRLAGGRGTHTTAWTGDVSCMFHPIADLREQFSIGVGASLLWQRRFAGAERFFLVPQPVADTERYEIRETAALGGHIKVEYTLPLGSSFDIGVRGAMHLFSDPFSGTKDLNPAVAGYGSIGISLRGKW